MRLTTLFFFSCCVQSGLPLKDLMLGRLAATVAVLSFVCCGGTEAESLQRLSGEQFDAVVVLSLASSDRRAEASRTLGAVLGPDFEFFDAFTFDQIERSPQKVAALGLGPLLAAPRDSEDGFGSNWQKELAISFTHMALMRSILARGLRSVLVFEDDIAIYDNEQDTKIQLSSALKELPTDWELFYLGWCYEHCERVSFVSPSIVRPARPFCTHAYAVTSSGAEKMLERMLQKPARCQFDLKFAFRTLSNAHHSFLVCNR
jgi:GR25 family glycosyltransferase involved in LPS biosynthesis